VTDVLLVVPPFASAGLPALGPSILVAALRTSGVDARAWYANVDLAARIGYARYSRFAGTSWLSHGELLFAAAAWGRPVPDDALVFSPRADAVTRADWAESLAALPAWIESVADAIAAQSPGLIGFSSVFEQTVPSIALAKALRRRLPATPLVLGGANAAHPMGPAIADATDVFDLIVGGEAEAEFPTLARRLLDGWRPAQRAVQCAPLPTLERSPRPAFDDYFEQLRPHLEAGALPRSLPVALPFESSRGCWWGQRSHCTFCGLNGLEMAERAHPPERVLEDIEALVGQWGVHRLQAVDNLLPIAIQRTVLPELARRQPDRERPLRLFYEVRSHLRRDDLREAAAAGLVEVQAGVESLSTATLKRMGKGVTGPMNLAFLRDARATGVSVAWNWMVGFPGDEPEDYGAGARLMPFIAHLQPPMGVVPVRIDRFSPYHSRPDRYGIRNITPFPATRWTWPDGADTRALSYHFTADVDSAWNDPRIQRVANEALGRWMEGWRGDPPVLQATTAVDGRLTIRDTRTVALETDVTLSAEASALLRRLEKPTPIDAVPPRGGLGVLLQRGLVVQHEGLLVSVVVR